MNNIYYLTYATHSERMFDILKESAIRNSINLNIVGYGDKWINWKNRAKSILNHIKKLDNNKIICHIDGFDSIILTNDDEIYNKFINIIGNKKIIFSSDNASNFIVSDFKTRKFGTCHNNLISAGLYIGYNYYIQELLQSFINSNETDDQHYFTLLCETQNEIGYDLEYIIFYNYQAGENNINLKYNNNRLIIKNNKPCIISAPGNINLHDIDKKFGYNYINKFNIIDDIKYIIKNGKGDVILYWKEIIIILIMIFALVIYNKILIK